MTDLLVVRMVVILLGLVALGSLVIVGVLAMDEKGIPDAVVATMSGSLGALSALLVRTSVQAREGG